MLWGDRGDGPEPLISIDAGQIHSRFDWDRWSTLVRTERYTTQARPLYTRLPFHYHRIPGTLRRLAAKALLSGQAPSVDSNSFPAFPIEQGLELVAHLLDPPAAPSSPPVVLTHDIDTGAGFGWVRQTAELEFAHGFQSTWHVVGQGVPPDYAVLDWLVERGCQVGLHGYNHDNKLSFLPADQIRRRFDACRPLIDRYGITCFRSPSWFRSPMLFEVARDYIQVDYSRLDTDRSCPGGLGGCLWTRPFTHDGLTHVPTTVPFEDPLYWGESPESLVDYWRQKIEWLRACNGGIVVNTHPEPQFSGNARMLAAYDKLLDLLAEQQKPRVPA